MNNPYISCIIVDETHYKQLVELASERKLIGEVTNAMFDRTMRILGGWNMRSKQWSVGYVKFDHYNNLLVQFVYHQGEQETFIPVVF